METGQGDREADYLDEAVPDDRREPWPLLLFATIGLGTALIYMQVGSLITLTWGSRTALLSIVYSVLVSSTLAWIIARLAARTGRGTSLLARAVLGQKGAGFFSLLYGITLFVFFIAEASIMASSIHDALPNIPSWLIQPAMAALIVPIVWFGMAVLARFQTVSFVLYAVLLVLAFTRSFGPTVGGHHWLSYVPENQSDFATGLLSALGIMNGLVFITALVSADFARYIRKDQLTIGPLWVGVGFQLFAFAFAGLLGMWFSVSFGESNPGSYFVKMLGIWGVLFAVATQIRINVANMYLGSLGLTNALAELIDVRVRSRSVILIFALAASVALVMRLAHFLETLLNLLGVFMMTFTVLLVVSNKSDRNETESDVAKSWRWPALSSFLLANVMGIIALGGLLGQQVAIASAFFACAMQIILYLLFSAIERFRLGHVIGR